MPEPPPTLWVTRCAVPTAASVALDDGGLVAALAPLGLAAAELDAGRAASHYDHAGRMLLREGGNVPALWARSRGTATRLVGLTWVDEYQAVVTGPAAERHGPGDLRGARLGVVHDRTRAVDHYAAMALRGHLSALEAAGLEPEDARIVDLDVPLRGHRPSSARVAALPLQWRRDADALERGLVDAIYVKGAPGLATVRALGLRELVSLGDHPLPRLRGNNGLPRTITVDAELAARPAVVGAALGALLAAADRTARSPAALHALVARDAGTDLRAAAAAYGAARLHPRLDDEVLGALDAQRAFLLRHGVLATDVDLDAWVDPRPLEAALATHPRSPLPPATSPRSPSP